MIVRIQNLKNVILKYEEFEKENNILAESEEIESNMKFWRACAHFAKSRKYHIKI